MAAPSQHLMNLLPAHARRCLYASLLLTLAPLCHAQADLQLPNYPPNVWSPGVPISATNSITAPGTANGQVIIDGTAQVTFVAGTLIDLKPGFHATAATGATFHAMLSPGGATYTIGGQITSSGTGLSGVTVALSGLQTRSTTTDASGNYTFTGLPGGGSYTVTPSKSNTTFTPASATNSYLTANWSVPVFTAVPIPSLLTLTSTHSGDFTQAQMGATYLLTARNAAGAGPTLGIVMITESIPSGLLPVSMSGTGWTCPAGGTTCTRADALSAGSSYPPITVTVNVGPNAPSQVTNQATVSGGGSLAATAGDATTVDALLRYSNPLAFAAPASAVGGVPTTLTVTYTSDNGPTDIASGQVMIDQCYFAWDRSGNVRLYAAFGYQDAVGVIGQASVLWSGSCSINLAASQLATPAANPKALVLTLNVTFPEQAFLYTGYTNPPEFVGPHEVYAWGTSSEGLGTGQVDLGSLVVSQGQDFTLTLGASETIALQTNATRNLTVAAAGLNGFTGSIAMGMQTVIGSPCFVVTAPASIQANTQTTITIRNNNCSPGQVLSFAVGGTAIGIHRNGPIISLLATPSGDFSVGVGAPSPAVLLPQSSVSFPVIVTSSNGQSGYVNLDPAGVPAGVTPAFSPSQVYLSAGGTATSSLTLYSSPTVPPGSYALRVNGLLGSAQHTAIFALSTLVNALQVASPTGSAIIHNTGQEVQVTHNIPAGAAPVYTTCGTADPNVTCRVISSYPSAVTLGITAATGTVHGTHVLSLNGGRTLVHAAVEDFLGGWGVYVSPSMITAGQGTSGTISVDCDECFPEVVVYGQGGSPGFGGLPVNWAWFGMAEGGEVPAYFQPPVGAEGYYTVFVDLCNIFFNPDGEQGCNSSGTGSLEVDPAPPPPTPPPTLLLQVNGTAINGTPSVVVGQWLLLTATVQNWSGQTPTYQWTLPSNTARSWLTAGVNDWNSSAGWPTPVPAANLQLQTVGFAWTNASDNTASVSVTLPGGPTLSGTIQFNITAPTVMVAPVQQGTSIITTCPGIGGLWAACLYSSSSGQPGIVFNITVGNGNPADKYEWVQVLNSSTIDQTSTSGSVCEKATFGVDGQGPQPSYIGPNSMQDSPGTPLSSTYKEVARTDNFSAFLMYMPQSGSFYVPLYRVDWTWSADAVFSTIWQFKSGGVSAGPGGSWTVVQVWDQANSYPSWSQVANPNAACVPKQ